MSSEAWKILAAALALAVASPAGAAPEEPIRLVGDTEAVWLVFSEAGEYKLAVKPIDRPWESPWQPRAGRIVAATAVRDSAVLFFTEGGHVRYFPQQPQGRPGINAPKALWPEGTVPLAACPADGSAFDAMLVLVSNPKIGFRLTQPAVTAPAPATGSAPSTQAARTAPAVPTTAPARGRMAVLRYAGGQWERLAVVPERFVRAPFLAQMALHRDVVYVLLDRPPAPALIALDAGRWRRLDLPPRAAGARPLKILGMPEGLLLATFDPAGRVRISLLAAGKWTRMQSIDRGEGPATWPAEAPPTVARLGSRLAVMWREEQRWFFGTCGYDANLAAAEVEVFRDGMATREAAQIIQQFFTGVLVFIIGLMFWPGQPLRMAPFSLPPTVLPARLGKRVAAFLIDAAPFAILSVLVSGGAAEVVAVSQKLRRDSVPPWFMYALLVFLTAYPLYCIFMERRWGATLGKLLLRLRVVADGGRRPLLREVILRNVSKIPELMAFIVVVPILFPMLTRYHQRLGDKIAWTAVIDAELSLPPDVLQPSEERPSAEDDSGEEEKL